MNENLDFWFYKCLEDIHCDSEYLCQSGPAPSCLSEHLGAYTGSTGRSAFHTFSSSETADGTWTSLCPSLWAYMLFIWKGAELGFESSLQILTIIFCLWPETEARWLSYWNPGFGHRQFRFNFLSLTPSELSQSQFLQLENGVNMINPAGLFIEKQMKCPS